jgi:hypothetical protein
MSKLTVGSIGGLIENSNVISVPTGHSLNVVDGIQVDGEYVVPYSGRKNLLINGDMKIAQRGTSASYGSAGTVPYHTADRWKTYANGTGSFTQSIENDGPAGFTKSLKILCTASATLGTGVGKYFAQELEGQDLQHLAYGTASAKTMTFSFWVKSNVVTDYHTVVFHFKDGTNTYLLSKTYSVSSADTWEYKTISVPGSTVGSGILNDTSAYGMSVRFWLSAGTDYTGSGVTNSDWIQWTDNEDIAPFYDQDISTSGDYWQITGVQLELGNKATSFEHRSFGEELALCQRYYEKTYNYETAPGTVANQGAVYNSSTSNAYSDLCYNIEFSVSKRVPPTMTFYRTDGTSGNWNYQRSGVSSTSVPVWATTWSGTHGGLLYQPVGAAYTATFNYGHWVVEAEL